MAREPNWDLPNPRPIERLIGRVDEQGRIALPDSFRNTHLIHEGSQVEISVNADGSVNVRPHSILLTDAMTVVRHTLVLHRDTGLTSFACTPESIVSINGNWRARLISDFLEQIIRVMKKLSPHLVFYGLEDETSWQGLPIRVANSDMPPYALCLSPVTVDGDVHGVIGLATWSRGRRISEDERERLRCAAVMIGR